MTIVHRLLKPNEKPIQCLKPFNHCALAYEQSERRRGRAIRAGFFVDLCMSNATHTINSVYYCRRHAADLLLKISISGISDLEFVNSHRIACGRDPYVSLSGKDLNAQIRLIREHASYGEDPWEDYG